MALLRLLHLPSSTHFCFHQNLFSPSPQPFHKPPQLNTTPSFPSFSFKLPVKFQRSNIYQFYVLFSTQAQPITQNPDNAEKEDQEVGEEFSKTRLLAQNFPWTSTADDLRPLFEKYGTVVDIETRNRGLAFVTMSSHEEALAAFSNLESYFQALAKDLKEFLYSNNGNVVSAEIIFQDNPKRSAGYGFVSCNTKEEAEAALEAFQGKEFMARPVRVACSRRFFRPATKANTQLYGATAESSEKLEKPDRK